MSNYNDLFLKALNDIEKLNIRLNNLTDRVIELESENDYLKNNLNINKKNENQEKKEDASKKGRLSKNRVVKDLVKKIPQDVSIKNILGGVEFVKANKVIAKAYISVSKDYLQGKNDKKYDWASWCQINKSKVKEFEYFIFAIQNHETFNYLIIPQSVVCDLISTQLSERTSGYAFLYLDKIKGQSKIFDVRNDSTVNLFRYFNDFDFLKK